MQAATTQHVPQQCCSISLNFDSSHRMRYWHIGGSQECGCCVLRVCLILASNLMCNLLKKCKDAVAVCVVLAWFWHLTSRCNLPVHSCNQTPVIDMLNHSFESNCAIESNSKGICMMTKHKVRPSLGKQF
eukprot:scaffold45207_cov18-Tisochrysis_lutea.AAC.4